MKAGHSQRPLLVLCLAMIAALATPSAASASTVSNDFGNLVISGDPDDDLITLSSDATSVKVTDTGTGGVTNGDPDPGECTQLSPTAVSCLRDPGGAGSSLDLYFGLLDDGTDSLTNQAAEDVFFLGQVFGGGSGVKTIQGGPVEEFILGGSANDVIRGGDGDDQLAGGFTFAGDPTAGSDTLIGEGGADTASFSGDVPVTVTLDGVANDGQAGEADNVDTDNVATGGGDDVIVGDSARNELSSAGGNDQVFGLGGDDVLDTGSQNDLADGGEGDDGLICGDGFDLALLLGEDDVSGDCERTGASIDGDNAEVDGKRRFRVPIECPLSEGAPCVGKLKVTVGGRKIGKGKFNVPAGETKKSKAKLTKKGAKALKAAGALLVTVEARTTEPGGVSEDEGRILIHG